MKRFFKIIVVAAVALFATEATADAQLLKNLLNKAASSSTTETVSAGTTNGQAAGVALKGLYTQYKADGKLDMGNLTNLMNLATLASNVQGLKGQTNKSAFYKDFAAGLITGSNNLVTSKNSTSVMSGLTNLVNNVDLSGLTSKAADASSAVSTALSGASSKANTAIDNANEIASSVTNILNLFNK